MYLLLSTYLPVAVKPLCVRVTIYLFLNDVGYSTPECIRQIRKQLVVVSWLWLASHLKLALGVVSISAYLPKRSTDLARADYGRRLGPNQTS